MSWDTQIFDGQQRLADLLNADPYISGTGDGKPVTVVTQRKGNLAQAMKEAVGKFGVVIIVMLPAMSFTGASARISLQPKYVVMVKENPTLNQSATGTGKPAEVILLHAIKAIHWQPNDPAQRLAQENKFQIDKNAVQLLRPTPGDVPLTYGIGVNIQISI